MRLRRSYGNFERLVSSPAQQSSNTNALLTRAILKSKLRRERKSFLKAPLELEIFIVRVYIAQIGTAICTCAVSVNFRCETVHQQGLLKINERLDDSLNRIFVCFAIAKQVFTGKKVLLFLFNRLLLLLLLYRHYYYFSIRNQRTQQQHQGAFNLICS